jgi:hypothetical protein
VTSAIFRQSQATSLYSSAAFVGIATTFLREPCCLAHVTTFRLWLFPVPTKKFKWNVLQNWSIAKIYVSPQVVETTHTRGRQSAGSLLVWSHFGSFRACLYLRLSSLT